MNLYLISQDVKTGWDTYDSAVVAAKDEEEARKIRPDGRERDEDYYGAWAKKPEQVKVELIGKAVEGTEKGVILSSFNAG